MLQGRPRINHHPLLGGIATVLLCGAVLPAAAAAECSLLKAVGGGTSVSKQIQLNAPLIFPFGRTNFNTDFTVTAPYRDYTLHFESTSSKAGPYPIQAFLKFSDGSHLQVVNETPIAEPGEKKDYGPFVAPPGKLVTAVNMKVGSGHKPKATGFGYTISVTGCL